MSSKKRLAPYVVSIFLAGGGAAFVGCQVLSGLDGLETHPAPPGGSTADGGGGTTSTGGSTGGGGNLGGGGSTGGGGNLGGGGSGGDGGGGLCAPACMPAEVCIDATVGTYGCKACGFAVMTEPCPGGNCAGGACIQEGVGGGGGGGGGPVVHICELECPGDMGCNDTPIGCGPTGNFPAECVVSCTGTACQGKTIQCPARTRCEVFCDGSGACVNTTVNCGNGPCEVMCDQGGCAPSTIVNCGPNECVISCNGSATPTVNDGETCNKILETCT